MLASREDFDSLLRCPRTGEPLRWTEDGLLTPKGEASGYRLVGGVPLLVDFEHSIISEASVSAEGVESGVKRRQRSGLMAPIKRLLSPPKDSTRDNVGLLRSLLQKRGSRRPLVLVIGGGTVGQGMQPLYDDPDARLILFDIYRSADVHFVADAHSIPLADASMDAVVVQAVLEHVLQPATVVAEIWRVLRDGGLVYAETPFLQHVHEGAYDFTRFTESGHRYLFRRFDLVASGASGGPGMQLMWSIDYFVRSLFRSVGAGKIAKLAFFWLRYLDRFIPPSFASDAASGVYFLGYKSAGDMTPDDAIAFYRGAQR
jgi:SAM-dependent methyltransferase